MPWQKMLFRNDPVWVLVGDDGRMVLDRDGRAEMKYRETDNKSYRPGPNNLAPLAGNGAVAQLTEVPARAGARAGAGAGAGTNGGPGAGSPTGPPSLRSESRSSARSSSSKSSARSSAPAVERDPSALEIWTDGACSGNPGPMGIGVVVIDGTWRGEIGEYLGVGTNNIAELTAIERGLEASLERLASTARRVRVHSDSGYAIGLLSKGWKAKANQELVARIRAKLAAFPAPVDFVKVAGHAGIPENERCDELARVAVERRR